MDFYVHSSGRSISNIRGVWLVFIIPCFIEIPVFNANSVNPDQMPRSAASDLGLLCLLMSLVWDARLKWIRCQALFSVVNNQNNENVALAFKG